MVVLNIEDAVTEEHGKYEIVELNDLVEITCDACDHKVLLERGTKLKIQEGIHFHTCPKCGQSTLIAIPN